MVVDLREVLHSTAFALFLPLCSSAQRNDEWGGLMNATLPEPVANSLDARDDRLIGRCRTTCSGSHLAIQR